MKYLLLLVFLLPGLNFAQNNECNLKPTYFDDLLRVTSEDAKCLARNASSKNTLFFTFARWCAPCIWHLPNALKLSENYDVQVYVLLVDTENSHFAYLAKEYVKERYPDAKLAIIADVEGRGRGKKYWEFLKEMQNSQKKVDESMSKYILLDQKGVVQKITTADDNLSKDWKDDSEMVQRLIVSLLTEK